MMDFIPVDVFSYDGDETGDSTRSKISEVSSAAGHEGHPRSKPWDSTSARLEQLPCKSLACRCFFIHGERDLFGGRHDGVIAHWMIRNTAEINSYPINLLRGHSGAVTTIDFGKELGRCGLLFSGSIDRTVKVWDPWGANEMRFQGGKSTQSSSARSKGERICVQTLNGHTAGVTCVKVLTHQHNGLVTCSMDRSVRTWYCSEGRALLLYPWFVPGQKIDLPGESWPTSLSIRCGADCSLFVADSGGCISFYTACSHSNLMSSDLGSMGERGGNDKAWHSAESFTVPQSDGNYTKPSGHSNADENVSQFNFHLVRRFSHYHALRISNLHLVADNCFIVSLGFDEKAQIIDAINGSLSATISCTPGSRFTSCCWDQQGGFLLLSDTSGSIHMWSMMEDKIVAKKSNLEMQETYGENESPTAEPGIISLTMVVSSVMDCTWIFTGFSTGIKQWLINRDIGYTDFLGHTQAVVSVAVMDGEEDDVLSVGSGDDDSNESTSIVRSAKFFSASIDNTIRCWDSYEQKAVFGFEERTSEITDMAESKKTRKLFTGHDNGTVKAWGVSSGEYFKAYSSTKSSVTCLDSGMVRDQEFLVAGDVDGAIWMWEVNFDSLHEVGALRLEDDEISAERSGEVTSLLFSEGKYLQWSGSEFVVAGYASGIVCFWSVARKAVICTFKAHVDAVSSLVMHGCFLFSSSDDLLLKMWNAFDPNDPYELSVVRSPSSTSSSGTDSPIVGLDVIQSLGLILSVSVDGVLLVWDYTKYEDENAIDACGKIVFRAKADERIQCLRYWPATRSVICGSVDGRLLVFALPPELFGPSP